MNPFDWKKIKWPVLPVAWRTLENFHFTKDAVILFAGTGMASLLFLLFHVLTGREMTGAGYAEMVAMIGLLNVLSVPAGVMQLTMARYIAEQQQREEGQAWLLLIRRGLLAVTGWGGLVLLIWLALSPFSRSVLNATSIWNVSMVGVIAFVFLYTPVLGGALQGSHRFGWFALSGIGVGVSRLVLAGAVLLVTRHVAAMLAVVAVSFAVGLLVSAWPLRGFVRTDLSTPPPPSAGIQRYFWGVLLSQLALYALIHADIILSPRLFEGETLAAYGKAATLSRIVFFLPIPIITAMFPRAVVSSRPGILVAPLLLTFVMCAGAAVLLSLFPEIPMRIMYGVSDPLHSMLMRRYVWAAIPLAMISVLSPYLWARREVAATFAVIPLVFLYLAVLFTGRFSANGVIGCIAAAGTATLLLLIWITWRMLKKTHSASRREGPLAA